MPTWTPEDVPYDLFTEHELAWIHRTFRHPSVRATRALLKRASGENLDSKTKAFINRIIEDCQICKRTESAPRRFKLTVGTDGIRFNAEAQIYTMFIKGKPVFHMVDTFTQCFRGIMYSITVIVGSMAIHTKHVVIGLLRETRCDICAARDELCVDGNSCELPNRWG